MKDKIVSADEAVAVIRDGDTLANTGFIGSGAPEELLAALARRFLDSGRSRGLTVVFAAGHREQGRRPRCAAQAFFSPRSQPPSSRPISPTMPPTCASWQINGRPHRR